LARLGRHVKIERDKVHQKRHYVRHKTGSKTMAAPPSWPGHDDIRDADRYGPDSRRANSAGT
jgi:hypothetical protein